MVTQNFCANSPLLGHQQDAVTGGQCSYTEDQLPDHTMPGESSTSSVVPKSGTTTTQPHSHGGVRICWSLK